MTFRAAENSAALIALLRADLTTADFTVARLTELWGTDADAALHRGHRVPARRAIARQRAWGEAAPLLVLATVFVLGDPVEAEDVDTALPSLGLGGAIALGLVVEPASRSDRVVHGAVDLRPYHFVDAWSAVDWWIASDLGEVALGGPLTENHVLGIGGASLTLSGLLLERPVASVLDLGTGCGIQALHASRHAGRVVATDISYAALEFARFNAELNGVTNIEFRQGDLFEPVAGEQFDAIVSNPPFVITPRTEGVPAYEYRDGGRVGDRLVADVVAGVSRHLAPGGIAQLLGNWEYGEGVDAFDRVSGWLDDAATHGHPLDAWVIEREIQDAALYAETWIRDGGTAGGEQFDRLSNLWLDDFERRRVQRVGFGYLILRRPLAGPPTLRRLERLTGPVTGGLSRHIAATLAAHDWQAALDDGALARAMLTVAPDVTEERHYWPGDEHPAVMNLHQGGGFGRSYPLDTVLAAIVGASDGELSIAALCGALAVLLSTEEQAIDADELLAQVLPDLREFVVTGFLTP